MIISLKNGSGIHIKKKNRGSFTKWCGGNVTNECILRGKNSSNPKIRKKATFADNARHFKHRLGGNIVEAFKLRRLILTNNARKWKHQEGGPIHRLPMLDRLHHNNQWTSLTFVPDERKLELMHNPDYYFDAGSFPEVVVTPNDLTTQHIKKIIPDKKMRNSWYNRVSSILDVNDNPTSLREYVDRVYNVWNRVGRPNVKSSYGGLHNFIFDIFAGKGREHNFNGTIYLKPEEPSFEEELAHSINRKYDFSGNSWFPADIKINGKDGYERYGHPEYVTHNIIEPRSFLYYLGQLSLEDAYKRAYEEAKISELNSDETLGNLLGFNKLAKSLESLKLKWLSKNLAKSVKPLKRKKGGKAFIPGHDIADSNPKAYKYVKKHYKMKALLGGTIPDFSNDVINQSSMISPFVNYTNNADNYLLKKKEKDELEKYRELLKINKSYDFWNNIANNASKLLYSIPLLLTAVTTSGTTATPGYFSDFTALDVTNYMNRNSLFKPKFTF